MKTIDELVWPVENYTDKINLGIKFTLQRAPHLSFTKSQIIQSLERGYVWLVKRNDRQQRVLEMLIGKVMTRLIQSSLVKKVKSKMSIEVQWMWAGGVEESGYVNVTSDSSVAKTAEAKKAVERRGLGGLTLYRLNCITPG